MFLIKVLQDSSMESIKVKAFTQSYLFYELLLLIRHLINGLEHNQENEKDHENK